MGHGRVMEASETICPTRTCWREKRKRVFQPCGTADSGRGKREVGLRVEHLGLRRGWGKEELVADADS
jgi:hypothetical protein